MALARALVIEPPVLLLDEPLSNLDAHLREEMQFEICRIQHEIGITTLMVTHDQAEALSISDRVVVMEAGRITQVDDPYRLYEHPGTPFISDFVGKANRLRGVTGPGGQPQAAAQGPLTLSLRPEKSASARRAAANWQGASAAATSSAASGCTALILPWATWPWSAPTMAARRWTKVRRSAWTGTMPCCGY